VNANADAAGSAASRSRNARAASVGWACVLLSVFLVGGELAARLDDSLFHGVPFFANPSDDDLTTRDWFGRRGRAHAQFGKWKLNNLGFRGPDITVERTPGCVRMVIMGASETLGYRESPGHEFPSLLADKLAARGCVEVVNAAVAGMTLGSMQQYWTYWVARLHPDVVLIYPSPLFYLEYSPAAAPPGRLPSGAPDAPVDRPFESRFISRLRGVAGAAAPRWLTMYRVQRQVRVKLAALPARPEINSPPQEGLAAFTRDLNELVASIRGTGARVVLITHAQRASWPIERRDLLDLWATRVFWPHASLPELIEFDRAGNAVTRETARQQQLQLIDAAAVLNGHFDCFGDLVHFNDKGAEIIASLIAEQTRIPGH
jgi:lysophospholipase L1-like esterase